MKMLSKGRKRERKSAYLESWWDYPFSVNDQVVRRATCSFLSFQSHTDRYTADNVRSLNGSSGLDASLAPTKCTQLPGLLLLTRGRTFSLLFFFSLPSLKRIRETKQTHKHVHTEKRRNPVIKISGADDLLSCRKTPKWEKENCCCCCCWPSLRHHRHLLTACLYDTLKRLFYALTSP